MNSVGSSTMLGASQKIWNHVKLVTSHAGTPAIDSIENSEECNLSAWLLKRKSVSRSRLFSSTNRRYFTLDFETRLLFYRHSETDKKVSQLIAFRNIISVQPLVDTVTDE